MNRKLGISCAIAALVAALPGALPLSTLGGEIAVVVPARERVVKLGFDVAALREAVLIAYQVNPADGQPVLHIWDVVAKAWKPLSLDAYAFGQFFERDPDYIYLLGADADLPGVLVTGAEQFGCTVHRIRTLDVADALNELNQTMKFSWREWRALSERHGLQIEDKNWALRKWGRRGPPSKKHHAPAPDQPPVEAEALAPAGIEAEPPAAETDSGAAPVGMDADAATDHALPGEPAVAAPEAPAVEAVEMAVDAAVTKPTPAPAAPSEVAMPDPGEISEIPMPMADVEPAAVEPEADAAAEDK